MKHADEELKFHLEQVGESSHRSRIVLYVLLVSSALIFAFNWKMRPGSWLDHRIQIRDDLLRHWEEMKLPAARALPARPTWEQRMAAQQVRDQRRAVLAGLGLEQQTDEDRAALKAQLENLQQQMDDTFKVPFVDVTFDINDFVIFSLSELWILTVIFLYCLVREEQNLLLSFKRARAGGPRLLQEFYEMAGMLQLWNLPAELGRRDSFFLRASQSLIFVMPLGVGWWVFLDDRQNAGAWDLLDRTLGRWMEFSQCVLVVMLIAASWLAGRTFSRMDRLWKKVGAEVKVSESGGPAATGTPAR